MNDVWFDDEEHKVKIKNNTEAMIRLSELNRVVCLFTDTKESARKYLTEILENHPNYKICIYSGQSRSYLYQFCNIQTEQMYFVRKGVDLIDIQPADNEVLIVWNFFEFDEPDMFMDEVSKPWDTVYFISMVDFLAMSQTG